MQVATTFNNADNAGSLFTVNVHLNVPQLYQSLLIKALIILLPEVSAIDMVPSCGLLETILASFPTTML